MKINEIDDLNHFFTEAAKFVFSKDVEWKKYKKQKQIIYNKSKGMDYNEKVFY